jgi:polysaccharide biosynthesis transport protein
MTFSQFLRVLLARWKALVLTLLGTVLVTLAVSLLLPKQYTASTSLVVDFKGMDPVLGIMLPAQLMPGYMATQVDIIQSHKVAVDVVNALKLTENATAREQWREATNGLGTPQDWLAEVLLKKLDVKPSRESNVVQISYTGSDPQFAAVIANAFSDAYVKTNLELRVDPARQSAAFFDEQLKILRSNLEQAQAKLNDTQRQKGYSSADERLDVESARLAELSAQYTATQAQAADALSRQRQLADFLARGANPDSLPDVLANPLVQNLKSQLASSEARLEQISSQLGANHPEVQRLKADIEQQRTKLKTEITTAGTAISNASRIAERREAELRQAVAEQKARLMRLNQGRDEMAVLLKEVETAQRAYEAAAQRFTQTRLESQTSQTNISVLTRAIPPIEPSSPRVLLNLIVSVFLGTMLGVGLALLLEMLNRRVRSVKDLAEAVGAPVLGVLMDDKSARRKKTKLLPGKPQPSIGTLKVSPKAG